tara:strand:- start:479 stop:628 length:150 start_codon:yes stop_codon:yes gene_type:complete
LLLRHHRLQYLLFQLLVLLHLKVALLHHLQNRLHLEYHQSKHNLLLLQL